MVLRDRWQAFDIASACVAGVVLAGAVAVRQLTFSRNLLFTALVLLLCFLILPKTVFGSTYADMRLLPYVIVTALLAIRFRGVGDRRFAQGLAIAGLAFCVVRLGGNTLSLAIAADDQRAKLAALEHVPVGARVISLAGYACGEAWTLPRNTHLGGMAIVRRDGFSNDQWTIEGANLLTLKYARAGAFRSDPSQIVRDNNCGPRNDWTIDRALAEVGNSRRRFDYLWLIDPGAYDPRLVAGMQPVWRGPGSILYRLNP